MIARPKLFVVGGPNGAGKSTFAHEFLLQYPDFLFLNADEIAREIQPANAHDARIDAGRRFLTRLAELRSVGANLLIESTLSGLSLAQQIKQFVAEGYYIGVIYVVVPSAQLSVSRVAGRVLQGGHHVPTEDIIRRFGRSKKNFWRTYRLYADEWQLIMNSESGFVYVARFENHNLTIQEPQLFQQFVDEQAN